jgi:hypothetical protein
MQSRENSFSVISWTRCLVDACHPLGPAHVAHYMPDLVQFQIQGHVINVPNDDAKGSFVRAAHLRNLSTISAA